MSKAAPLMAAALAAGLAGCGRNAHDASPAPGAGTSIGSDQERDPTMTTAKLREIVAKAITNPAAYPELEVTYLRGHDLSGITRFTIAATGAYQLESSVTRDEQQRSWSGTLAAEDRDALLQAIASSRLLDVASSTRNIGDDEEPIFVTVRAGALEHEVRVWHDDVVPAGLGPFEAQLLALARRLSSDEVLTIPAQR